MNKMFSLNEIHRVGRRMVKKKVGLMVILGILLIAVGISYIWMKNKNIKENFQGPCYSSAWYINELQTGITFEFLGPSGMIDSNTLLLARQCMECTTQNDTLATLTSLKQQGGANTLISIQDPTNFDVSIVKFKLAVWSSDDQANAIIKIGLNGNDVVEGSIPGPNTLNGKTFKILFLDFTKCPVDCVPGPWVTTSPCYPCIGIYGATYGQTRTIQPAKYGGKCSAEDSIPYRTLSCDPNIVPSCASKCVPGEWSPASCPTCGPPGTTVIQYRPLISQVPNACAYTDPSQRPTTSQSYVCPIPPCEEPPPPGTIPVFPYPFSCTDTYDIKIVYSNPPDANKNVTLHALLLLKPGAVDVTGKTSTWTVTSAPNFSTRTGAPVIGKWTDRITWQFPLAQKYTINYRLSYGGKTCSFSFDITIAGQTCTDPCTNLNTTTNYCQRITLPPAPPRTINGPRCQDVRCGPNQFKDCPIVYQPGNSPTNPCTPGNVYDFVQARCVPSGEHCCNYSLTTGALDQTKFAAARNDTRCVDNITQQYRLRAGTTCRPKFTPGVDNRCCDPRAATLPACAKFWEAIPSWKKTPQSCSAPPPFLGFKDYGGFETEDLASVDNDTRIQIQGALKSVRQKFIDLKSIFA